MYSRFQNGLGGRRGGGVQHEQRQQQPHEQQPMVEMSQDCPIEWNESQDDIDLQQLAKSPRIATPGSTFSSSKSSISTPSTNQSNISGKGREVAGQLLDDVKRRLEDRKNDVGGSPTSLLQTQPPWSSNKKLPSNGNQKDQAEEDDEIDGIFSILKRDDGTQGGAAISPAAATTQRTSNISSKGPLPKNDTSAMMPPPAKNYGFSNQKTSSSSSLASKFQRRRRVTAEFESNITKRRRRHHQRTDGTTKKTDSSESSFSPPSSRSMSSSNDGDDKVNDDGKNEFDVLLQQWSEVSTSSKHPPKRVPLKPIDKNVLNMQGTISKDQKKESQTEKTSAQQKQSNMCWRILPNAGARSANGLATTEDPSQQIQPPPQPPTTMTASNQVKRDNSQMMTSSTLLQQQQKSLFTIVPPRQITAPPSSNEEDDDFGDFPDLDDDANAQLDMLLSMTSSQQILPPTQPAPSHRHSPMTQPPESSVVRKQPATTRNADVEGMMQAQPASQPPSRKYSRDMTVKKVHKLADSASIQAQPTNETASGLSGSIKARPPTKRLEENKSSSNKCQAIHGAFSLTTVTKQKSSESTRNPPPKSASVIVAHTSGNSENERKAQSIREGTLTPKPTSNPSHAQTSPGDDFGDFPEIDFDALDKNIQTYTQMSQFPAPSASQVVDYTSAGNNNFGPLTFPMNVKVMNPKVNSLEQGLSFAAFSRYKVLDIFIDNKTFTKRLTVAAWTESMRNEQENERNIHRNIQITKHVTNSPPCEGYNSLPHDTNYGPDGYLHLRGEWYHSHVSLGDAIHVCSLSGRYKTDPTALPIILHTNPPHGSDIDDLVLIVHPDILITPTTVSETVGCARRAVLKSRIGSTGLSSKAALVGTMRHSLFETCIKEQNFDHAYVHRKVQKIVRKNAEALLSCSMSTEEAETEVMAVLPMIQEFFSDYTDFGKARKKSGLKDLEGHTPQSGIRLLAHSAHSVEEPLVSHELALKGFADAILETTTQSPTATDVAPVKESLMSLELKTGHNQKTQSAHIAQLELYILLLQISYGVEPEQEKRVVARASTNPHGASAGAMLLYLNQNSYKAIHVSPLFGEIKSLIEQRNVAAIGIAQSTRPRGIVLSYDEENKENQKDAKRIHLYPAPPVELPLVKSHPSSCERCFSIKECMLYASTENDLEGPNRSTKVSHKTLFDRYTRHLRDDDKSFFRHWDRLLDLEAHASNQSVALSWLTKSRDLEIEKGETISRIVYEGPEPAEDGGAIMVFKRWNGDATQRSASLNGLSFSRGDQVVIGTDSTSIHAQPTNSQITRKRQPSRKFRHRMHIVRCVVHRILQDKILVSGSREDLERIRDMVQRYRKECQDQTNPELRFRIDKDKASTGMGTLRQNLINFLTADSLSKTGENESSRIELLKRKRMPRLRDIVIRHKQPSKALNQPRSALFMRRGFQIPGCDVLCLSDEFHNHLNSDQQNAVEKVVNQIDFSIVQGLPGTGKTATLAFIVRLLAAHGKRVLVTSYTHSAVDNVVLKLMEKDVASTPEMSSPLVRIAKKSSCHEKVHPVLVSELASQLESVPMTSSQTDISLKASASSESLKRVVSNAKIVCCTALSVPRSALLMDEQFDVVIVDEAGQISLPAILGPLMSADSFVLFGDHLQLPPLVVSEIAQSGGFGLSLMHQLAEKHPASVSRLTYQYRMNNEICRLSSRLIYDGMLKCGTSEVSTQVLDLPRYPEGMPSKASGFCFDWLKSVINPSKPSLFVDTDNIRKHPRPFSQRKSRNEQDGIEELETKAGGKVGGSVVNPTEATLVRYLAMGLVLSGLDPTSIGVISPFRAQLGIIGEDPTIASLKQQGLEVSTIDRYQGRDKPVIILSLVRSNKNGKTGRLLQDIRRLNVALTRAKKKLLIIGSFSTLKKGSEPLNKLLQDMERLEHRVLLPEDALQCYEIPNTQHHSELIDHLYRLD